MYALFHYRVDICYEDIVKNIDVIFVAELITNHFCCAFISSITIDKLILYYGYY